MTGVASQRNHSELSKVNHNFLYIAGRISKAKSPSLQERLAHCQRTAAAAARSNGSGPSTAGSSPASSGHSGGTVYGGGTGASSHAAGSWTDNDKAALLALVQEVTFAQTRRHMISLDDMARNDARTSMILDIGRTSCTVHLCL